MKLVTSGDWHPDFAMMGMSRFDEVERAVRQSVAVAIKEEARAYLFLGDLADPDSGGETFKAINLLADVALELKEEGIDFIAIAGNHDILEDATGATTLTPLRALEAHDDSIRIHIEEHPQLVSLDAKTAILCLPYTAPSHPYDPAQAVKELWPEDPNVKVIVISHLMLTGIHPGSETKDLPRGRDVMFPFKETAKAYMRLQGHYHKRQTFDPGDGGPLIRIPGSLCRLTFGEETNEPGFLIVDIPTS